MTATMICECGKSTIINFKMGEKPIVTCECGKVMKRSFANVDIGKVLPDNVSAAGQALLWGDLPSGKSKSLI
jgi:hypothetical protein